MTMQDIHVARSGVDRWKRKILEWSPRENKRRVGTPKIRWEGEIIQYAGIAWGRDAWVRVRWRKVGEAYARLGSIKIKI